MVPLVAEVAATYLTRPDLIDRLPVSETSRGALKAFGRLMTQMGEALLSLSQLPASPGYEPWLVEKGYGRLGARGLAAVLVHGGRRRAQDSRRQGEVVKAIRFLAKPSRCPDAILRRAKVLLDAWEETSVIESFFSQAGQDEFQFIRLLKRARDGESIDWQRLSQLAAAITPFLKLPRGPKISAAAEAHAFLAEIGKSTGAYTWNEITGDFVDRQTLATRQEFDDPHFDPRPTRRRLRRTASPRGTGTCHRPQ